MTKEKIESNMAQNNTLDLIMMGAAVFTVLALSYLAVLPYIRAVHPLNYILDGGFISFLLYVIVSPIFRR